MQDYYQSFVNEYVDINTNIPGIPPKTPKTPEVKYWVDSPILVPSQMGTGEIELALFDIGAYLRLEKGVITVFGNSASLPHAINEAIALSHDEMVRVLGLRLANVSIVERIEFLRHNETKGNKPRAELVDYIRKQIDKFKEMCDLDTGYTDPFDPFAENALVMVDHLIFDLTKPGNPYPLRQDSG